MYMNQQDAQNSCDQTLLSLNALHVSDCISPSSGAIFVSCTSHLLYDVQLINVKMLIVQHNERFV